MPIGPGKYDDALTRALRRCKGRTGALLVFDGEKGPGFACQATLPEQVRLPEMLRYMADEIEASLKQGKL